MVPKLRVLCRLTLAVSTLILSIHHLFHLFHFITLLLLDPTSRVRPIFERQPRFVQLLQRGVQVEPALSQPAGRRGCLFTCCQRHPKLVYDYCSSIAARVCVCFSPTGFLAVPQTPPLGRMAVSPLREQWLEYEPALKLSEKPIRHPNPKGWSHLSCSIGEGRIGKDRGIFGVCFSVSSTIFLGATAAEYKWYVE